MPKMQTSFTGLVALLAKNLYTSADVFIRELTQNAHDGCQRRLAVEPESQARIDITTSLADRTITFADNGIGMDEPDIHEYLSTIGRSGTATETARMSAAGLAPETIGQFGVGLLSAFVVAERIDVFTRKLGQGTGYHWVSHGGDEYTVSPTGDAPDVGTEITVTVKSEFGHFLRAEELVKTVRLFADFLAVPIYVNGEGPVNSRQSPWHVETGESHAERLEEYQRFLARRYQDSPLLVIPVEIEAPHCRGLLYITDQPIPRVGSSGMVDLYVRRMCIRLNDPELLPDWATFVRGVLDCDLQPTAARDNVQRDTAYHQLRRELGDAIIRALLALRQSDGERFVRLCNWHEAGIKGMALRDEGFFSAVCEHLPFNSNEGTLALPEYLSRQKPSANGRKPLYYFSFDGDETQFFQLCSANHLLAINAGRFFDEPILRKYADRHHEDVELRRLDHLNSQQLYADPGPDAARAFGPVLAALQQALSEMDVANMRVGLRGFAPESMACVLLDQAGADVFDRFQALLNSPYVGSGIQELAAEVAVRVKQKPTELLLNCRNPFVQSLLKLPDLSGERAKSVLAGLYHLALLNSQRRIKSENARRIDGYLQARLSDLVTLDQHLAETQAQAAAWRRCVEQPAGATAEDWVTLTRSLVGRDPAAFRERVSQASDAEVGELLLGLYRQMKQL